MTVKTEKYVQIGTTTENQLSAGRGWSPILANVIDGDRVVQQVVDWTGGNGSKPVVGQYIGVSGFVQDIADATDIKGEQGADGAPASLQNIDDRIVVQLDTGGTIKAAIDVVQNNIDTHEANTANPHAVTKAQVGLTHVADVDTTTTANITDSTDKRFVTDAQQAKFVAATTSADGYLTSTDWNTFTRAGTVCTTNPSSPVTMVGTYSRSYSITANTTFDLSGWVADAYTLTIRNDSSVTSYTVTLNGVTGETFLLEGGVGGAQGNIGSVTTSITLRAGETIEVRSVGTNVYRIRSSFLSWNFMGDFKIRSTYTSGLRDISFTHASGAAFATSCVITVPNVAAVDLGKIPTALSYSGSTLTVTNTDATTLTATIPNFGRVTQVTANTTATINTAYSMRALGGITLTLPASGMTTGDSVIVNLLSDDSTANGFGSGNIIASSNTRYIRQRGATGTSISFTLPEAYGGALGITGGLAARYIFTWNATDGAWYYHRVQEGTQFDVANFGIYNNPTYAQMVFDISAIAGLATRTVTCPNTNVNLGKIPTALSYSASTDTLTHTNTDGTTLTATVKTKRSLDYALSDQTTAITTGTPLTCRAPYAFTITGVKASLKTAQTSGSLFTVDVKKNGTSLFSTLLTFDNTEKTTATAATAAVLSSTTLADDDELTFIVTQVGDGTAIGLVAYIIGYPT